MNIPISLFSRSRLTVLWLLTLLIRPVNTPLVFRTNAKAGTGPALAHAACRRAGASLPLINPACLWAGLIILLTQTACSPFTSPIQARPEDLSKIFVEPFTTDVSTALPSPHVNAAQMLTDTVRNQLSAENRLQTDISARSLRLVGMIVSYQDATLDVQGELYDGDKFLVYSRVKRHLAPDDDWERGIELVVEQLLDELIGNMRALQQPEYSSYYAPYADSYFYGNSGYASSYFSDDYYRNWGWWRHHRNHDHHETKKHWVSDALFDKLPRSTKIHRTHDKSSTPSGSRDTPVSSRVPRSHGSAGSSDSNSSSPQSAASPASGSNPPSPAVPPGSHDAPHTVKFAAPRHLDSSSNAISDRQTSGSSPSSASGSADSNRVPAASRDGTSGSSSPQKPVSLPPSSGSTAPPSPASTSSRESAPSTSSTPAPIYTPSSSGSSSSTGGTTSSSPAPTPSHESSSSLSHSPAPAYVPSSSGSSSSSGSTMGSSPAPAPSRESAPSSSSSPAPVHVPSSSGSSSSSGGSASGAAPGSHHHKSDK